MLCPRLLVYQAVLKATLLEPALKLVMDTVFFFLQILHFSSRDGAPCLSMGIIHYRCRQQAAGLLPW